MFRSTVGNLNRRVVLNLTAALLLSAGMATGTASGQSVSSVITYQGQLKNGGAPANGDFAMTFNVYDALVGGTLLWDESYTVTVTNGLFTRGVSIPPFIFNGNERYLEVVVGGTPLTPRQRLAPAPYAMYALGPWLTNGTSLVYHDGDVGIGPGNPGNTLSVAGGVTVDRGGSNNGGLVNGLRFGGDGHGEGIASKKSGGGNQNGLDFYTNNTARMQIANGGNVGIGTGPDESAGQFRLVTIGQNGLLAIGHERFTGVVGDHFSEKGGTGVLGMARTRAIAEGEQPRDPAFGVRGEAFTTVRTDLPGFPDGSNTDAYGVYGMVTTDGLSIGTTGRFAGVLGRHVGDGGAGIFGVYSDGPFAATGTKAFQIDHPLDPENKILNHYCAEGPEPLNVYSGTIVTDASGTAWVQLPDYFEAINRDPRYQLTVIGTFAQAIIGEKIKHNTFSIRTSAPNVEVSWEVKAIRNDLFVQRNGAPVEVMKGSTHRGKFLSPQLYGQPREMSVFHTPAPTSAKAARSSH